MANISCAELSVLVVDDQEISRDLVRENLVKMGFKNIQLASTSAEAEEKIAAQPFDIVFVDWLMPGKSGFAMMQRYREDRAYDHVAFVMVTGQSEERFMIEAMKAGATSYIIKPAVPTTFRIKVESVLDWVQKRSPRFKQKV